MGSLLLRTSARSSQPQPRGSRRHPGHHAHHERSDRLEHACQGGGGNGNRIARHDVPNRHGSGVPASCADQFQYSVEWWFGTLDLRFQSSGRWIRPLSLVQARRHHSSAWPVWQVGSLVWNDDLPDGRGLLLRFDRSAKLADRYRTDATSGRSTQRLAHGDSNPQRPGVLRFRSSQCHRSGEVPARLRHRFAAFRGRHHDGLLGKERNSQREHGDLGLRGGSQAGDLRGCPRPGAPLWTDSGRFHPHPERFQGHGWSIHPVLSQQTDHPGDQSGLAHAGRKPGPAHPTQPRFRSGSHRRRAHPHLVASGGAHTRHHCAGSALHAHRYGSLP